MIRALIGLYGWRYPRTLVYMLQSTEYQVRPYLAWVVRTKDFGQVMQRRQLVMTKAARLLIEGLYLAMAALIIVSLSLIYVGHWHGVIGAVPLGVIILLIYPYVLAYLAVVPLVLGRLLISRPRERKLIVQSEKIFAAHPAIKIAVAGSYGKTTMKELLATVLSEGKVVAATPANKNVAISHAYFARKLTGKEEMLVIEYGEGAPGDVAGFACTTHPDRAIITGIAPAHLDQYKTVEAAARDIFAVADYVKESEVYVNGDSPAVVNFIKPGYEVFTNQKCLGWQIKKVHVGLGGIKFQLEKGSKSLALESGLVGRHQLGFLGFVAALALELGLTPAEVRSGIAKTKPFEHRMQPYQLGGAWIVDDTYNGNLEGIRAGTALLQELSAKRKIYVSPGLVDQGMETESVHIEMGKLIAQATPDLVVLMQNSVTNFIQQGLKDGYFKGEVRIEPQPLEFYTNLGHFVAAGDLVVMQNDWTDNYA